MPGAKAASNKVIPQPGADAQAAPKPTDYKVPPAGMNPVEKPAPITQGAGNNRTGAGNAGL